jgi:hypothetical protein
MMQGDVNEWIDLAQQKPLPDQACVILLFGTEPACPYYRDEDGKWAMDMRFGMSFSDDESITHWFPIPELPAP